MTTLLRLDSSISGEQSASRRLTALFTEQWALEPGRAVITRDLHADPLPHLETSALHWAEETWAPGAVDPDAAARRRSVIDQLLQADVLLIGVPLYNYSMPSTLKAWLDHIHVPGVTTGPGTMPMAGRTAILVGTRGAGYEATSPSAGWDHALPPLQIVLGASLGMEVHTVTTDYTLADRVPELAEKADEARAQLKAAEDRLRELAR